MNRHEAESAIATGDQLEGGLPQPETSAVAVDVPAEFAPAELQYTFGNALLAASASSGGAPDPTQTPTLQQTFGNAAVARTLVQRKAGDGPASAAATPPAGEPEGAGVGVVPSRILIVEDTDETVQPEQMRKTEFLTQLRSALSNAAAGTSFAASAGPRLDTAFAQYSRQSSAQLERTIHAQVPEANAATSATVLIQAIVSRASRSLAAQSPAGAGGVLAAAGSAVSSVSSGISAAASGIVAGVGSAISGLGSIFFKERAERSQRNDDPAAIQSQLGGGHSLESGVKSRMESAYGQSFSGVEVHTDANAGGLSDNLGARAFTVGQHVAFGAGEYKPGTLIGDALIAHELAHVVQQRGGAVTEGAAQKGENAQGALEQDADEAAVGAVVSTWGGAKKGLAKVAKKSLPGLKSGLRLQRCDACSTRRVPTIADAFALALLAKLNATPPDKAGFFNDIRAAARTKAGDAALRDAIEQFFNTGLLTGGEMFRAVALQELGEERLWPDVIKNFAQGADRGVFVVSALPPAGANALLQYCVVAAGQAADQPGKINEYRRRFSAKWEVPPYAGLPADFDPTLDSKGPRNQRAREIFKALYAEPDIKAAYDGDTPAGFRNLCDSLVGPEGLNLIASPRIQELRALLAGPPLAFPNPADPAYLAFKGTVRPKAEALDANDRLEIKRSHAWRLLAEDKVTGTAPAATPALREDFWILLTTSMSAGPVVPPPVAVPAPPEPAPVLNAAQQAFLAGIVINPPPAPQNATTDHHPLRFDIHSGVPNPGLAARRKVELEPAAQVVEGQEDESDWPNAAKSLPHIAKVNPDAGGPPSTKFTAKLTMPPVPVATFPEKTADVVVVDKRMDWFKANITAGVQVVNENDQIALASGGSTPYFGGQLPLSITPALLNGVPNPGLNVTMEGEMTKGGVAFKAMPRTSFPADAVSALLFNEVLEAPTPAPLVKENMVLTIRFFQGPAAGVLFHTLIFPFAIKPAQAVPAGTEATILADDDIELNKPIATPGTFLHDMFSTAAPGSPQALVAQAAAGGAIRVKPFIVRSDSAAWMKAKGLGASVNQLTAYALGQLDDAHTRADSPGAAGWRYEDIPGTVFLNRTPNIHHPNVHRPQNVLVSLLTHEGIHAVDRTTSDNWGRYVTEFRAYWVMGVGAAESTAPNPSMSNLGPKSPRARKVFEMVYGSDLYPYVKPAYDSNDAGFRQRVDNYLYPDGINLTLSVTLGELRTEVESYSGLAADYAAKKTAIAAKFAATTAADKDEIKRNRDWRDLVEEKYKGTVVISPAPLVTELEKDQIKVLLGIPQ